MRRRAGWPGPQLAPEAPARRRAALGLVVGCCCAAAVAARGRPGRSAARPGAGGPAEEQLPSESPSAGPGGHWHGGLAVVLWEVPVGR
jgi:hypothetical protein